MFMVLSPIDHCSTPHVTQFEILNNRLSFNLLFSAMFDAMKRKFPSVQSKYDAIKPVESGERKSRVSERLGTTPGAVSKVVQAVESGIVPLTPNEKSLVTLWETTTPY